MVETSPCMKAQGGLLGELSSGQRSPLGQYTSPSPLRLWMYTLVQGKQNLRGQRTRFLDLDSKQNTGKQYISLELFVLVYIMYEQKNI